MPNKNILINNVGDLGSHFTQLNLKISLYLWISFIYPYLAVLVFLVPFCISCEPPSFTQVGK